MVIVVFCQLWNDILTFETHLQGAILMTPCSCQWEAILMSITPILTLMNISIIISYDDVKFTVDVNVRKCKANRFYPG